jgi:hypothetical protein
MIRECVIFNAHHKSLFRRILVIRPLLKMAAAALPGMPSALDLVGLLNRRETLAYVLQSGAELHKIFFCG